MYRPNVRHEPRELIYVIRKGRKTSWLRDNSQTNCTDNDGIQGRAFTEQRQYCHKNLVVSSLDPVGRIPYGAQRTEPLPTESHGKTKAEANTNSTIPGWLWLMGGCGEVVFDDRQNLEPRIQNTINRSLTYTELGYNFYSSTEQHWRNRRILNEIPFCRTVITRTLIIRNGLEYYRCLEIDLLSTISQYYWENYLQLNRW